MKQANRQNQKAERISRSIMFTSDERLLGWGGMKSAHRSDGAVSVVIDRADPMIERVCGECSQQSRRIAILFEISVRAVVVTVSAGRNAERVNQVKRRFNPAMAGVVDVCKCDHVYVSLCLSVQSAPQNPASWAMG